MAWERGGEVLAQELVGMLGTYWLIQNKDNLAATGP